MDTATLVPVPAEAISDEALVEEALAAKGAAEPGGDNGNIGALVPVEWLVRPWSAA